MKKATQKSTPVNIGTKRSCPKCGTKFYDFAKPEPVCPKCEVKLDLNALSPIPRLKAEPKKAPKPVEKEADEAAVSPRSGRRRV